jgi:hypothetical protein
MKNCLNIISMAFLTILVSACGGGSSGSSGGGGGYNTGNQATGNQNMNFDCVVTQFNQPTEVNGISNGGNYTYDDECNQTGSEVLTLGVTITLNISGYVNGVVETNSDIITLTSPSHKGYFNNGANDFSQAIHLDSNGNASLFFKPTVTGTQTITLQSSNMTASGIPAQEAYELTTITFTVQ